MHFVLYSHVVLVRGKQKSAIYNLKDSKILYVPNIFADLLEMMPNIKVESIKERYSPDNPKVIDNYLEMMIKNSLGFFTEAPDRFPPMDTVFRTPCVIYNAVLETDLKQYDLPQTLDLLDELGCRYVEIRLKVSKDQWSELEKVLSKTKESLLVSMVLILEYQDFITKEKVLNILKQHQKIGRILIYLSPQGVKTGDLIEYRTESLKRLEETSFIKPRLIVNTQYYTESLKYNTTYHKKVSINIQGDIKNILWDERTYGNVNKISVVEVVQSSEFQKWWFVTPDQIEELKDSSLRYAMFIPYPLKEAPSGQIIFDKKPFAYASE